MKTKLINHINKFLFIVVITLITLIVLKANSNFKTSFYKYIYEDNISFADINNLYEKYFGNQIPFKNLFKEKTSMVFSEKLEYQKKEKYKDGVKLSVSEKYAVPAIKEGMVVFVGEKEKYGKTIIISGTDGIDIWYSNINSNVKLYDYIEKGKIVGDAIDSKIYLLFKKNQEILNYEEYI